MKAWEIQNGKLALHDVEPARSRTDETIVYVSHIGICGSDLPKLLQPSVFALPSRWRPGHEIVGTDPDGQAVVIEPLMPCNICLRCVVGDTHLCSELRRLGWDLPGGFAEQVVVPATNVHSLPDGLKPITAILADAAAATTSAASTFLTSQALSVVADRGLTAGTGEWDDPYRLIIIFGAMFLFIGGSAMWCKAR
jgi:threonine dehydrogenase-like Zn-dependent dehydrogenase